MISIGKVLYGIAFVFDLFALAMILFAGYMMIMKFFKLPKEKGSYSLSHKNYVQLRKRFVHRIILALDLFIVADLVKLAFANSIDTLVQILLIVVIRTILSYFLMKEDEMG